MSNKIIKIEPVFEYYSINWILGSFCNYSCSYCPDELHDTTSKPHELDTLKTAWSNIHNKTKHLKLKYKIGFSGGEVTANKSFLPFVRWLRKEFADDIYMVLLTTNGSASLNYYTRLAKDVEAISFSTHSEFMDEDKFFEKVIALDPLMIRPEKSFHVNIMDEAWNQESIQRYKKLLDTHNISYSVNRIFPK
jgi:MoaA/NifB/PqqE/SkfB family radical SAM enzyme